jgi:hypothetical protein
MESLWAWKKHRFRDSCSDISIINVYVCMYIYIHIYIYTYISVCMCVYIYTLYIFCVFIDCCFKGAQKYIRKPCDVLVPSSDEYQQVKPTQALGVCSSVSTNPGPSKPGFYAGLFVSTRTGVVAHRYQYIDR